MIIRRANLKDVKQISGLGREVFEYHEEFDFYYAPVENVEKIYDKYLRKILKSKKKLLLVAEENKNIVGYAIAEIFQRFEVFKIRKVGWIGDVYIKKEYRRKGLLKKILKMIFEWFAVKGAEYAELYVHSKNVIGKKAWQKYGFEEFVSRQRINFKKSEL